MMSNNHEHENQDQDPTTVQSNLPEEQLSEQDLDAVSGGQEANPEGLEPWKTYTDPMGIGGEKWLEEHGPITPEDAGLGPADGPPIEAPSPEEVDPNQPLVVDPNPPPAPPA